MSSATQLRARVLAAGSATVFVIAAGVWVALSHSSAGSAQTPRPAASGKKATQAVAAGQPLRVTSVTPTAHSSGVSGVAPIKIQFSAPVATDSPMPSVRPAVAGTWRGAGTSSLEFVPSVGFRQSARVVVRIPGGALGLRSTGGRLLRADVRVRYRIGTYRTARLDQLLAQLGYLPLTWTAAADATVPAASDAAGQLAAAYSPPQGHFTWKPGYPSELRKFWRSGSTAGLVLQGAVRKFEWDHGLTMDGTAGPMVWAELLKAAAARDANKDGYTYAITDESSPETLTIWHDGRRVFHSLANTGIAASPTTIGTAPVYIRFYTQIMRGRNPDGSKYADRVYYVAYFRNGEAVHYFLRGSYGSPQSLGCVELPMSEAKRAWPYLTYGSLVTVLRGADTPGTSPTDPTT